MYYFPHCIIKNGIIKGWKKLDLSSLGEVDKINFIVSGSDLKAGTVKLNTPMYFCIDDIAVRK